MIASHFILDDILMGSDYQEVITGVFDTTLYADISEELAVRVSMEYQSKGPVHMTLILGNSEDFTSVLIGDNLPPSEGSFWTSFMVNTEFGICDVDCPMRWALNCCPTIGNAVRLRNVVVSLIEGDS